MIRFLTAFILLLYAIRNSNAVTVCVENSLLIWYHSIFPILFPGMLCSGFMLPYLKKLVHRKSLGKWLPCLILLPGFLCGFPLGTYLVTDLYKNHLVSVEEADIYIGFTNNISPLFMLSIVLKDYPFVQKLFLFLLFYSIPLLYGFIMLWNHKRKWNHGINFENFTGNHANSSKITNPLKNSNLHKNTNMSINANMLTNTNSPKRLNMSKEIHLSKNTNISKNIEPNNNTNSEDYMNRAIENILRIAGYIILFRLIILLIGDGLSTIFTLFQIPGENVLQLGKDILNGILEISSCVISMNTHLTESLYWKVAFPFLTFGGWCTCLQTKALLPAELSFSGYVRHKLHQTLWMTIICFLLGYQ